MAIIGSGIGHFTCNTLSIGDGTNQTVTIFVNMPDGYQNPEDPTEEPSPELTPDPTPES